MKNLTIATLLLCSAAIHADDIAVTLTGAPENSVLVFQVYDSPNAFGDFRDPIREVRENYRADGQYVIGDVTPGDVAVLVFVDENNNGLIDKNFIGIPKEPLGISNNYRPKGPPSFERAKFSLLEGETNTVNIEIYKVLGERGRLGVGVGVIGRSSPYIDSDETVLQPIPVITYIGEKLQWLGPSVQYALAGSGQWRLAATASYRIGVYEENDSPALVGLGDRDGALMAGLGFRFEAPGGVNLSLRYEHDVLDRIGGGAASARASKSFQLGWLRIAPEVQANWLSADLTNYDFGVPASAATLLRPEYNAGSAMTYAIGIGSFVELTENWRIILNVSTEFLPDEITDSPIVGDDTVVQGFAAFTYVF